MVGFLELLEIWIKQRTLRERILLFCFCFFAFAMLPLWGLLQRAESSWYYQKTQSKELQSYLSQLQKEFLKVVEENNIHQLEQTIADLEVTLSAQEKQKFLIQTNSSVITQFKLFAQEFALERFILAQEKQIFLEGSGTFKNVFGFLFKMESFFKALKIIDFSIYPNANNLDFIMQIELLDVKEEF
ncbi:hypothetical protein [Helicobacter apodemus]|uniref:Uncharacterized protein n=1 Tax=Helicobacter apodemus TaxID=135569 RepID=A0A2U8FE39_9HELI|nr:hypothetical protein [Helicobacter apodemus]AWI34521.1 hypothetical protein CDV25_06890 [Helicobacter apodemus]